MNDATFLCTRLSSHGYVVAALDHSVIVAAELARRDDETSGQKTSRGAAWIANRVPDIRFFLDHLLDGSEWNPGIKLDPARVEIVGHSIGGWTALAAPGVETRIRAVVALAPAGDVEAELAVRGVDVIVHKPTATGSQATSGQSPNPASQSPAKY